VVIAILATISAIAYSGIQNGANGTVVKNDLSSLKKMMEVSFIDKDRYLYSNIVFHAAKGSYAVSLATAHNLAFCMNPGYSQYAVLAMSKSGNKFYITNTEGVTEYAGSWVTSSQDTCEALSSIYDNNYRGYASEDTTNGPWRAWAGGN
jgi:hypothetical protein